MPRGVVADRRVHGVGSWDDRRHAVVETWVPPTPGQWLAVGLLGLGPVGTVFYVWDHGTKQGDLQILGALAYCAPLLSTLFLVLAGEAEATWPVGWACVLIAGGAVLASKEMLRRRRPQAEGISREG